MAAITRLQLLNPFPVIKSSLLLPKYPFSISSIPNLRRKRLHRFSTTPLLSSSSNQIPESSSSTVAESPSIVGDLLDYLNESWTQFHATDMTSYTLKLDEAKYEKAEAKRQLIDAGFHLLNENDEWDLKPGGRYFFTRNMSCLVAFAVGEKYSVGNGFHVIAAHTDSPCLKLKPKSASLKSRYLMVNVQTYGSGLWHTWFDRDLSVAGRAIVRSSDGSFLHKLVKVKRPLLRVPTLAIHLDSTVNKDGFKPNLETHLIPLLATKLEETSAEPKEKSASLSSKTAHHPLLMQVSSLVLLQSVEEKCWSEVLSDELSCGIDDIVSIELNVCDTQPSCLGGGNDEFIFSGRLDNLASSYCAFRALVDSCGSPGDLSSEHAIRMVALFDNEEAGMGPGSDEAGWSGSWRLVAEKGTGCPDLLGYLGRYSRLVWGAGVVQQVGMGPGSDAAGWSGGWRDNKEKVVGWAAVVTGAGKRAAEAVGSNSVQGAGAPTMFQAMRRIVDCLAQEYVGEGAFERSIRQSFLVSADMAHGVHPNFMDKHEEHHRPELQKGLVIKHNANQRYATSGVTAFLFKEVANIHNLPTQEFVVRNDMGCGSTIGPILASGVGIRTVDCGIAQLSMHSVREICGKEDVDIAYKHFKAFYQTFSSIDRKLNVD
ncbi:hypothetical protein HHK36_011368 [Tetracentron sinense]|uniref:aspartyl aminopeptidase n=1 Tax=Tetracentron sinense TaxID=13715 RepID=A0A834ZIH1_TETSI|nr:hypothetical protein HHK36_011368 [Tetracentron sinense]